MVQGRWTSIRWWRCQRRGCESLLKCQVYPTIDAKTSWNSSFYPTVRLQRLWQRRLSRWTRLGLAAQSSTSLPCLSKANRRSMPVTVHRLPWATLRNQAKMDSVSSYKDPCVHKAPVLPVLNQRLWRTNCATRPVLGLLYESLRTGRTGLSRQVGNPKAWQKSDDKPWYTLLKIQVAYPLATSCAVLCCDSLWNGPNKRKQV